MTSWSAARAATELAAVAGGEPVELPRRDRAPAIVDPAREEFALALRVAPTSMAHRLHSARNLAAHPQLAEAVRRGACSLWSARTVLAQTEALDPGQAATVIDELLDKLHSRHAAGSLAWTAGDIRAATQRLVMRLFPDAARRKRAQARASRRVVLGESCDGMSDLIATLNTTEAVRIHRRLTAVAAGLDDPTRTRDQKRADVLADLLLTPPLPAAVGSTGNTPTPAHDPRHTPSTPHAPGAAPSTPHDPRRTTPATPDVQIHVVVPLATLLRLADEPGELLGHGPLDPDTARELAADAAWDAWVTDPSGRVIATGSRSYTPSERLARLIRAREPQCRMPGCRRQATSCDLDHTVPYPRGATTPQNLGPLCRRHHNMKTHRGWQLHNEPPEPKSGLAAGFTWVTPAGVTAHCSMAAALE